ncbi:hypothetical protein BDV18DRAFT_58 [Aspergillus unguis]
MRGSGHVLSTLNTRWNSLCCSVEECSTDGDSFDFQLVQLARLYHLRNFYSLTAILQSIRSGKRSLAALQTFDYLIDPGGSYLQYRLNFYHGPSLHFLFLFLQTRFELDAVAASSKVVSAAKRYSARGEIRSEFPRHTSLLSFWRFLCL